MRLRLPTTCELVAALHQEGVEARVIAQELGLTINAVYKNLWRARNPAQHAADLQRLRTRYRSRNAGNPMGPPRKWDHVVPQLRALRQQRATYSHCAQILQTTRGVIAGLCDRYHIRAPGVGPGVGVDDLASVRQRTVDGAPYKTCG